MTTTVRFFTSAALRPYEEVTGEIIHWLPRWATVEFEGSRPVTGVWHSVRGRRRICWYTAEHTAALVGEHLERYGDEPFWIVDLSDGHARVRVIECGGDGRPQASRVWEFDDWNMPTREEEHSPDGASRLIRTYKCVMSGVVVGATERRPGRTDIKFERPISYPIPELGGEPFPCGRTITATGARLIASIAQNSFQGRFYAAYREASTWKRGIATISTSRYCWPDEIDPIVNFNAEDLAPLVQTGELQPRWRGNYPFFGVVEVPPEGRSMDEVVAESPLPLDDALSVAIRVAAVAQRAHAAGHELGGIRPELVYVRGDTNSRWSLSGIMHRGQAVIDATHCGEGICVPPVFPFDFSSRNDAHGLAQLLWYALTGGHPHVAPEDFRQRQAWRDHECGKARRQPWTGPAAIGRLLESVLFESGSLPRFEPFAAELVQLQAAISEKA